MIAICMARDEDDIISGTVAHLFEQGVGRVVVADNLSTDSTAASARRMGALVVSDPDPAYRQADKMTALCQQYATEGEFVIPFDADEFWSGLDILNDEDHLCPLDVVTAITHVHIGPKRVIGNELHPKVAFRWTANAKLDMGNHRVFGAGPRRADNLLDVCHHQYRTLEQVKRKVTQGVAAYALTDLGATYGKHWRDIAALTDDELLQWWEHYITQPTTDCPLVPACMLP